MSEQGRVCCPRTSLECFGFLQGLWELFEKILLPVEDTTFHGIAEHLRDAFITISNVDFSCWHGLVIYGTGRHHEGAIKA